MRTADRLIGHGLVFTAIGIGIASKSPELAGHAFVVAGAFGVGGLAAGEVGRLISGSISNRIRGSQRLNGVNNGSSRPV